MAYSFSFDASLKLRGCDIRGFLNHFMREEHEKQHSNEFINSNMTKYNMTLIYNADTGKTQPAISSKQIIKAINTRLSKAIDLKNNTYISTGKKVRSDAIQCRGFVVQLDPQFYKDNENNPNAIMKSFNDMFHIVQKQFGKENIVSASLHLDETNPHIHVLFVPITDDGRLSQKDFIDKKKLQEAHKVMREELCSIGYDIDLERRTPKGAKRLSEQDYKILQDSSKKLREISQIETNLIQRKKQLDEAENQLENEKAEFEHYKALEQQQLDANRLQSQQIHHQANAMFQIVKKLYDKLLKLHNTLVQMDSIYLQYAQGYGTELGEIKHEIDGISL